MQNVRRKRMVLDNFAVRKINFSSLIKGFLPVEIMRWKLDFMYPSRSCARGQHRAKTRKQMNDRSWHKKDRPAQTSLSLVDLMGFEPTTSRMRTSPWNFFRAFPAVFSCFRSAPLHLWVSLTMLFPCGPGRCVVGSVVRNAPQPLPVFFADRDGERFLCLLTVCIVTLRAG